MKAIRPLIIALALAAATALASCGGDEDGPTGGADKLTIYSGRQEELVGELIERFERSSGVDVEVRYGDSAELAATIAEEGGNTPADIFFSQDAGALGAVDREGLLGALPSGVRGRVPARFRDARWIGVSGRARVLAYNTKTLSERDLPKGVLDLVGPEWKGRVGIAPQNASFQAFVSAMRIALGDARTRSFLGGLEKNGAERFENNIAILEAISRGEVDVGLVNHYYLAEIKKEQPAAPVANHFLRPRDPGALVNVAGVGVLRGADSPSAAARFVRFLLSPQAQRYFVDATGEYPVVAGASPPADVPALADVQGPEIKLGDLGAKLPSTLRMLDDAGFTT
jgi:iron(III) transport system substrate-binding protein